MLIGAVRMALTVASLVELLGLVIGAAVLVLARGDAMGDGLNVGR